MPVAPNIKIKYFSGTMDDPSAIYEEIEKWLQTTTHVGYQVNSTVHFHENDRMWHILVTVMYKVQPVVSIPTRLDPTVMMVPRLVD